MNELNGHLMRMEGLRWADTLEALESLKAGRLFDSEVVSEWLKSWGRDVSKPPPEAERMAEPLK